MQKKIDIKKTYIIVGGSGGQGIITIGKIISLGAIKQGYSVSCLPAYGAEMRGGYVYCTIAISQSKNLFSPISSELDAGIFMNDQSSKMLASSLKKNALMVINSSLIKNFEKNSFKTFEIPATELAEKIGEIRNANMIMAGALGNILNKNFLKFNISSIYAGISGVMADKRKAEQCKPYVKTGWESINNGRTRNKH